MHFESDSGRIWYYNKKMILREIGESWYAIDPTRENAAKFNAMIRTTMKRKKY